VTRRDALRRVALVAIGLTGGLTMAPLARGDAITEVKQLAGQWKGNGVKDAQSFEVDLTIRGDGTYKGVGHLGLRRIQGVGSRIMDVPFAGAIQIENGQARFKHADGSMGVITLEGRTMKWVRDDQTGVITYEPVK
jgi:hypothetical protein